MNSLTSINTRNIRTTSAKSSRMSKKIMEVEAWASDARNKEVSAQIKRSINEIVSLKDSGSIDDEVFSEIIELFVLKFIENEVNLRLEGTLMSKLKDLQLFSPLIR
ncbi:MAG: hypothetical protein KUG74_14370 [Rhodobacteraceae bacterium]|nr:hypothetical protein [Paracoccaceae bacterium]